MLLSTYPKIKPLIEDFHREQKALERFGSELTQQWRAIRSFGLEYDFADRNERLLLNAWRNNYKRHHRWRTLVDRPDRVINFSRWMIYNISALLSKVFMYSIGSIVLALDWASRVYSNLYRLSEFQRALYHNSGAVEELFAVFKTEPTVQQAENPIWPEKIYGQVKFENVSFRYPEGNQDALSNIDLTIEPGQVFAVIGRTGSGKTTLESLLQREYDPTTGRILIDGIDLRDLDFVRYRKEVIGVVHQHSILLDDTVRENIRVSRSTAAADEELFAARQAYADEFIETLEQGYETLIGENGVRLSGGQRQRLAIARALHRQPKILIMDEPTSALDADSQEKFQQALEMLIASRSCTIFLVAHRFSTIMGADKVVVMDRGQIVEVGTHNELAKLNGLYAHYRDLELGGYFAAEVPA